MHLFTDVAQGEMPFLSSPLALMGFASLLFRNEEQIPCKTCENPFLAGSLRLVLGRAYGRNSPAKLFIHKNKFK